MRTKLVTRMPRFLHTVLAWVESALDDDKIPCLPTLPCSLGLAVPCTVGSRRERMQSPPNSSHTHTAHAHIHLYPEQRKRAVKEKVEQVVSMRDQRGRTIASSHNRRSWVPGKGSQQMLTHTRWRVYMEMLSGPI